MNNERIFAIQNLSVTPITIDGILLNQNSIGYPTIGYWLTNSWRTLTTSTTIKVFLSTGIGYDLTTNPDEYANAFARTANYVTDNYLNLLEIEKLGATIITNNNTITTIAEFSLPNGVHNIEYLTEGIASVGTNAIGERNFTTVKVVAGVYSLVGTLTQDRKSNFGATIRSSVDTTANSFRIRVTGQAGVVITWSIKLLNK